MRAGAIGNLSSVLPWANSCAKRPRIREFRGLILEVAVQGGAEGVETVADVTLEPDGDVVVAVDLGREAMDVNDFLVTVGD